MSGGRRRDRMDRRGGMLVEVLVAVTVFAIGLLSLMAGSLIAARAMKDSKSLASAALAAQTTMDSLKAVGFDGIEGASGSYTVRGHAVSWSVSAAGVDPRKVLVVVTRQTSPRLTNDSLITYVGRVDVVR